jgi:hypothetical protein
LKAGLFKQTESNVLMIKNLAEMKEEHSEHIKSNNVLINEKDQFKRLNYKRNYS